MRSREVPDHGNDAILRLHPFQVFEILGAIEKVLLLPLEVAFQEKLAIGRNWNIVILDGESSQRKRPVNLVDGSHVLFGQVKPAGILEEQANPSLVSGIQDR